MLKNLCKVFPFSATNGRVRKSNVKRLEGVINVQDVQNRRWLFSQTRNLRTQEADFNDIDACGQYCPVLDIRLKGTNMMDRE